MFRYCIISIFLCATAIVANAQDCRYADSLMQAGRYEMAAIEYERCHYLATTAEASQTALHRKAECYKLLQRFDLVATTLKRCAESYDDLLHLTLSLYLSGQFAQAVETAESAALQYDTTAADLLLLQTLALNEMGQYDAAHAVALRMAATLPPERGDTLRDVIEQCYAQPPKLKSEDNARWLSLIPGLGHLYAGYPLEAVAAFTINAAALGFGVWQVFERCYITAYIGGAGLLSATYPGAMRSATIHAKKTNERRTAQFNQQCRERLVDGL